MSSRRFHTTSRTAENFTKTGLISLTGQSPGVWGRYIVKEAVDNALEAFDDTAIDGWTPAIDVTVEMYQNEGVAPTVSEITVADNGPGISESDLERIFGDPDRFGGTKRHHGLPTRGNQGNALMTILGVQHVCGGALRVETNGRAYSITTDTESFNDGVTIDIGHVGSSDVDGCAVTVDFDGSNYGTLPQIESTFEDFAILNPQATLRLITPFGTKEYAATAEPTTKTLSLASRATTGKATWFSFDAFRDRLRADVRAEPSLTTKSFVREFCKLSSKHNDVLTGFSDEVALGTIKEFFDDSGHMRKDLVRALYTAMQDETSEFSPSGLDRTIGSIGSDLETHLADIGGAQSQDLADRLSQNGEDVDGVRDLVIGKSGGAIVSVAEKRMPFYFELAAIPTAATKGDSSCQLTFGINQSVTYSPPSFAFGDHPVVEYRNKTQAVGSIESAFRALGHDWKVVCNLTCPNIEFEDKGKQNFDTAPFTEVISEILSKTVKKIERDVRPGLNRLVEEPDLESEDAELDHKAPNGFIGNTVREHFWDVYNEQTRNGELRMMLHQMFYKMRDRFDEVCERERIKWTRTSTPDDKTPIELKKGTFADIVSDFEEEVIGHRVLHRDARGFFTDPHSSDRIALSTDGVQKASPNIDNFDTLLYVEKTGFWDLLHSDMEIDQRFDVGLIMGKGKGTGAYRDLVEKIQGLDGDIPLYTLSDFDIDGITIAVNADEADELSAIESFGAERIGIDVETIEKYDLRPESATYNEAKITEIENRLQAEEVSQEEFDFLTADSGQRVEINALSPTQLEDFLKTKFEELGIEKVTPDSPDDVETPSVDDASELRKATIDAAIGSYIREEAHDDLVDAVSEKANLNVDDYLIKALETAVDNDIGEVLHERICDQLEARPPDHWTEINQDLVDEEREEIDERTSEYRDAVKNAVSEFLKENATIEVTIDGPLP